MIITTFSISPFRTTLLSMTKKNVTLSMNSILMLSFVMLAVVYAKCRIEVNYADCRYTECRGIIYLVTYNIYIYMCVCLYGCFNTNNRLAWKNLLWANITAYLIAVLVIENHYSKSNRGQSYKTFMVTTGARV